jgi:choline kinase
MKNLEMVKELVGANRLQEGLIMLDDMFLENLVPKSDELLDILHSEFQTGNMICSLFEGKYELSEDCLCIEDDDTFYKVEISINKVTVSNITKETVLQIIAEIEEEMKVA